MPYAFQSNTPGRRRTFGNTSEQVTVKQNICSQQTGKVISPILQIRSLRLSGVDQLVSGHPAGEGTQVPGFRAQAPSKCCLLKTTCANRPAPTHQPRAQVRVSQRDHGTPEPSTDGSEDTGSALGAAAEEQLWGNTWARAWWPRRYMPRLFGALLSRFFLLLLLPTHNLQDFQTPRPGPTHSSGAGRLPARPRQREQARPTPPRAGQPGPAPPAGAPTHRQTVCSGAAFVSRLVCCSSPSPLGPLPGPA